jgi:hypothetical protein
MIILPIISFFFYFISSISVNKIIKITFSFLFVVSTLILRFLVQNSQLHDYDSYFSVIGAIEPEFSFNVLLTEPYYFQLVNLLFKYFSAETSINVFYGINYFFTTCFFIWLLFVKDIQPWKKVLLFSLFYYLLAYLLLRNTLAYLALAYMFYRINFKVVYKLSYAALLSHLSSLPALFFGCFKNKRGDLLLILSMVLYVFMFSLIINVEAFRLYEKFSSYQDSTEYGFSMFHKVYFYGFLFLNLVLFLYSRNIIYNYSYLPLFVTYIILQISNGVMGYRFSIYLIFYLLLFVSGKKVFGKLNLTLNYLSILLIFLSIYNFKAIST